MTQVRQALTDASRHAGLVTVPSEMEVELSLTIGVAGVEELPDGSHVLTVSKGVVMTEGEL